MGLFSDLRYSIGALGLILQALPVTLIVVVSAFVASVAVAFLFTAVKIQKIRVLEQAVNVVISFLRGTPVLVQLYLAYFGLPVLLEAIGINVDHVSIYLFPTAALALNGSAFLSEIMRSAWLGVSRGQIEAAYAVGMGSFQMFRRIMFPQALKIALPNLGNYAIDLLKETSLVFSIGLIDIMGRTKMLSGAEYGLHQLEDFILVAAIYWIMCFVLEKSVLFLEKRYGRGDREIGAENKVKSRIKLF